MGFGHLSSDYVCFVLHSIFDYCLFMASDPNGFFLQIVHFCTYLYISVKLRFNLFLLIGTIYISQLLLPYFCRATRRDFNGRIKTYICTLSLYDDLRVGYIPSILLLHLHLLCIDGARYVLLHEGRYIAATYFWRIRVRDSFYELVNPWSTFMKSY